LLPERAYSVAGQASYDNFGGFQSSYDFKLTVSNNWWGMEFVPLPPDGVRFIQICDGSNLVSMTYFRKSPMTRGRQGVVEVQRRSTPIFNPEVGHVVFVAFAGQFYLPPGTNGLLSPLWHPEREVNQVAFVQSDWHLLAPGRPDFLQCRYEAHKWNEVLRKKPKGMFAESYWTPAMALYHSVNTTNMNGEIFPADYAFTAFAPDRDDGKNIATPVYAIQVTNVTLRPTLDERLLDRTFKGVAVVVDYRSGPYLEYNVTNAAPPGLP